jgi:glycosyltransferase involved in cell wall biosynthesis
MKVLILTPSAYGGHGGIAQYNRDLIEAIALMEKVDKVKVLPRIINFSVNVEQMPPNVEFIESSANSVLGFIFQSLKNIFCKNDLVICAHINFVPLAILISLLNRSKTVLVCYGVDVWSTHQSFIVRKMLRYIDRFWSISDITKRKMIEWSSLPETLFSILPNAIYMEKYGLKPKNKFLIQKYGLENKKVAFFLGRLDAREKYKGIDEVFTVIRLIVKEVPNFLFLIGGDGTDKLRLIKKAKDLGISKYVKFIGYVDENLKPDHYRLADFFLMPSSGEGFGFVFLEALACGIPVIAGSKDGGREAVRNGLIGNHVDPKNKPQLLKTIFTVLNQPKKIPNGLCFFSFENFSIRVRKAIYQL